IVKFDENLKCLSNTANNPLVKSGDSRIAYWSPSLFRLVRVKDGNFFGVGSFEFGCGGFNWLTGALLNKGFIDKIAMAEFDPSGIPQHMIDIGIKCEPSFGTDIAYDGNNSIYMTGSFLGKPPTDFDPGRRIDKHLGKGMDAFLTCYDSDGNYKWTGSFGGDGQDMATDVVATGDSRIFVMGYFSGTIDFDPGSEEFELTSSDPTDIFLAAYEIP
ncbi:MAG: hypothetical protein ABIC40_06320, partial [bacterium]